MLHSLIFALMTAPVAPKPLPTMADLRYEECVTLAAKNPADGVVDAGIWIRENGGSTAWINC